MTSALTAFNIFIIIYFVVLNGTYLLLSFTAFRSLRRYMDRLDSLQIDDLLASSGGLPISLVVPAFNESASIVPSVRSLLTLTYADYEIVVVNDGSNDDTLRSLIDAFDLEEVTRVPTSSIPCAPVSAVYHGVRHQNLTVIDKANGGKADALNAGLNYSRSALFCAMDADTMSRQRRLGRGHPPSAEHARSVPGARILASVPCRPGRMELDRRHLDHLGSIRGIPAIGCRGSGRVRPRYRRRGHGAHRSAPSSLPRSGHALSNRIHPGSGCMD